MNQNEQTIKYFLYARKSSENEDRQVASIDAQISELKKIAEVNNLEVVNIFQESKSAKEPGRPIFNEMLNRIAKGEADGIICWKLNRLARNPIDGGQINWMLQQSVIKQIYTNGKSYYPTDNVLLMAVELGMANQFIRDLSVDTKRGLKTKAERGWFPNYTPLGYGHNPIKIKGEKEIIEDPERFNLTRKMFNLMLTGTHSPSKILEIATNEWGLKNKKGRKIAISTLYRLFSEPFYYGEFEFPKGSGNWYKGKHKPMISEEEFNKIQLILGKGKHKQRPKTKEFAYTGLIKCEECGAFITAEDKVKKQKNGNVHFYTYYHCTKRKDPNCKQKSIRVENLEEQIMEELKKIRVSSSIKNWALEVMKDMSKEESKNSNQINKNHQEEYNNIIKKLDGLIEMRANGEITPEEFNPKKKELNDRKNRLIELLNDQNKQVDNWLKKADDLFVLANTIVNRFKNASISEKATILSSIGSNLLLLDGKLSISLNKELKYIKKLNSISNQDSTRLEPLKSTDNKGKTRDSDSRFPMMLPTPV